MAKFERKAVIGQLPNAGTSEGASTRALADTLQGFTQWGIKKHGEMRLGQAQEEAQALTPTTVAPELKTKMTQYGQAYNKIVTAGHAAAIKNDYTANFQKLHMETTDPEEFYAKAKAYKIKTLSDVLPEMRNAFELDMDNSINHYGNDLSQKAMTKATEESMLQMAQAGESLTQDMERYIFDGDYQKAQETRALFYMQSVDSLIEIGKDKEANILAEKFEERYDKQMTLGMAQQAILSGDGDEFIKGFIKDPPKDLSRDQVNSYTSSMSAMNSRNKSLNANALSAQNASIKAKKEQIKYEINTMTEALGVGYSISDEKVKETNDILLQLEDVTLARKFNKAVIENAETSKLLDLPLLAQEQTLLEMQKKAKTPEQVILVDKIKKAQASFSNKLNDDPLKVSANQGLVQLKRFDESNPVAWLQERIDQSKVVENHHGIKTGAFTDEEIPVIAEHINKMDLNGKINFVAQVNQGAGDKALDVYEQLRMKNIGGTLSVAGQVAVDGDLGASGMIIRGSELRKLNPDLIEDKKNLRLVINESLASVYSGNPQQLKHTSEAILDVYAQLTVDNGMSTPDVEDVIGMVTGGVIEYNGRNILPSSRGETEEAFEDRIESMKGINGIDGYTKKQISNGLDDEDLVLYGYQKGTYLIKNVNDGKFLYKNRNVFIFDPVKEETEILESPTKQEYETYEQKPLRVLRK